MEAGEGTEVSEMMEGEFSRISNFSSLCQIAELDVGPFSRNHYITQRVIRLLWRNGDKVKFVVRSLQGHCFPFFGIASGIIFGSFIKHTREFLSRLPT